MSRRFSATLSVPVGSVLASKLVVVGADGGVRWESGEDRSLFVPAGEGPLNLGTAWRGE